jgi:general secretion pathway protein F
LVERATRIVEPLLLLLVAVFVGALVVMMYMPIFDMAGGLGGSR